MSALSGLSVAIRAGASLLGNDCRLVSDSIGDFCGQLMFGNFSDIPGRFIEIPDGMSIAFSTLAVSSASPTLTSCHHLSLQLSVFLSIILKL